MTKLEHCLENAIVALEDGKDFDTWLYEERGRGNIHAWGNSDAVLTDASVIDVKDIWELANYVQFVVVQNVKSAGYNKWLKENPYLKGFVHEPSFVALNHPEFDKFSDDEYWQKADRKKKEE